MAENDVSAAERRRWFVGRTVSWSAPAGRRRFFFPFLRRSFADCRVLVFFFSTFLCAVLFYRYVQGSPYVSLSLSLSRSLGGKSIAARAAEAAEAAAEAAEAAAAAAAVTRGWEMERRLGGSAARAGSRQRFPIN